jgi:hypothetical protein
MPRELTAFEREIQQIYDAVCRQALTRRFHALTGPHLHQSLGFINSPRVDTTVEEYPAGDWDHILQLLREALKDSKFYHSCCAVQGDDALCIAKVMGQVSVRTAQCSGLYKFGRTGPQDDRPEGRMPNKSIQDIERLVQA